MRDEYRLLIMDELDDTDNRCLSEDQIATEEEIELFCMTPIADNYYQIGAY